MGLSRVLQELGLLNAHTTVGAVEEADANGTSVAVHIRPSYQPHVQVWTSVIVYEESTTDDHVNGGVLGIVRDGTSRGTIVNEEGIVCLSKGPVASIVHNLLVQLYRMVVLEGAVGHPHIWRAVEQRSWGCVFSGDIQRINTIRYRESVE